MPKDKSKINVKDHLEENVMDLSLLGNFIDLSFVLIYHLIFHYFVTEIEFVPVKDIAACRRVTTLDLSSNNIKFLPVS